MKSILVTTVALFLAASVSAHDSPQALQDSFMEALRASDAADLHTHYAQDAVSFDVSVQRLDGPEAIGNAWGEFFSQFRVLEAELINPHIEVHGDTGLAWGEWRLMVEPTDGGEAFEMMGRYSDVTRSIDGQWYYVMDHISMPQPEEEVELEVEVEESAQ